MWGSKVPDVLAEEWFWQRVLIPGADKLLTALLSIPKGLWFVRGFLISLTTRFILRHFYISLRQLQEDLRDMLNRRDITPVSVAQLRRKYPAEFFLNLEDFFSSPGRRLRRWCEESGTTPISVLTWARELDQGLDILIIPNWQVDGRGNVEAAIQRTDFTIYCIRRIMLRKKANSLPRPGAAGIRLFYREP